MTFWNIFWALVLVIELIVICFNHIFLHPYFSRHKRYERLLIKCLIRIIFWIILIIVIVFLILVSPKLMELKFNNNYLQSWDDYYGSIFGALIAFGGTLLIIRHGNLSLSKQVNTQNKLVRNQIFTNYILIILRSLNKDIKYMKFAQIDIDRLDGNVVNLNHNLVSLKKSNYELIKAVKHPMEVLLNRWDLVEDFIIEDFTSLEILLPKKSKEISKCNKNNDVLISLWKLSRSIEVLNNRISTRKLYYLRQDINHIRSHAHKVNIVVENEIVEVSHVKNIILNSLHISYNN